MLALMNELQKVEDYIIKERKNLMTTVSSNDGNKSTNNKLEKKNEKSNNYF